MNIDHLIKMANEIGSFWEGEVGEHKAANDVATHLKRYWEPRMRNQMITYFEQREGAGLSDVAKRAVALLASQAKAAPASVGDASAAPLAAASKP
jgi:NADH-dependent formate dehydrogenase delta subunit FdsD